MVNIHLTHGREETVALVDAGPGGASVAILKVSGDGPSQVIATATSALTLEARTPEQANALIGTQIQEAGQKALDAYHTALPLTAITRVHVILHAPWMQTRTITAHKQFADEIHVQDSLIGEMAQEALAAEKGVERSKLLEASIIRVELNGYPTGHPAGKYAHQVGVISMVSECDTDIRDAVAASVGKLFPAAEIMWRSAIRALMTFVREGATPGGHCTIVDIGTDTTQIISVRGMFFAQRVIPEGVRTILARVAAGRMPEEVLGTVRMLARDACSTEACEAVQKALATSEPELLRTFGEAIGQMAATRRAANNLLLVTHPDLEVWLSHFFSRIDFSQFTVTTLPFSVSTPTSVGMGEWVTGDIADDSLAIGATFVNIESRE